MSASHDVAASVSRLESTDGALPPSKPVETRAMPFALDRPNARQPAIGMIVLATDCTIENELRRLLPSTRVSLYHSRIENDPQITPESLVEMDGRITEGAATLVPGSPLDVVGYGCTSATVVMGEDAVFRRIRAARPGVSCTSPITAAIAAFNSLGVARIALLTPYRADLMRLVQSYLCASGLDVPVAATFDEPDDNAVARISEASIYSAAVELGNHDNVDAVFISCTTLRAAGVVEKIERALNKPVTTSTHALAWHCLRLAGMTANDPRLGRLYDGRAGL
jgi:maleate isomerase